MPERSEPRAAEAGSASGSPGLESGEAPSMTTGIETAIAGTIVKMAIERGAPAGIARLTSMFKGKTVMVVGPARSGKTTFVRYLQFGIFMHADETQPTYDPVESPRFNLRLGPNKTLEVSIKSAVDLPGQYPARRLADEAFDHRPHALVYVLDLTAPLEGEADRASGEWLKQFCERLDQRWQGQKPQRNRLRSVIVAMNKMDLVDAAVVTTNEKRYKEIMSQSFRAAKGPNTDDVVFRRSIMVENPDSTKWVDAILVDLASSLTRKR
jgi:signal recognition particle receptor subunit beta